MNVQAPSPVADKPAYRVPLMSEIAAVPWNGLKVVSTFAGCGGSSTGYRMAGFKVVWANEFVPAACDSYAANMDEATILDRRDIRGIQAADILAATGLAEGELDLFDGSPPCQAFSTAGKREKGWGKDRTYEHGAKQKNEDLFFEYVRLLRGLKPKVFVAENVSGLIKGVAKGYFLEILAALKACGYRVECRLLDAQWLGVPQMRQRTIFVGVRDDLGLSPVFPKPLGQRYSVRDALPWPAIAAGDASKRAPEQFYIEERVIEPEADISRFEIGKEWAKLQPGEQSDRYRNLARAPIDGPCQTVSAIGGESSRASVTHPNERRKFTIAELRRICAFPDDFILTGSYAAQWERLGNSVPPVMMWHIASVVHDEIFSKLPKGIA